MSNRLCLFVALAATAVGRADDREDAATAALKAAKIDSFAVAETADLRVFATLPKAKTTPLATAAQKAHAAAATALKKDADLWGGRLTVFAVTDARQTRALLLFGLKQVGSRETVRVDPKADAPYALVGVGPGEKRTDAQFAADVAAQVATAVLTKAAGDGAELPAWLRVGFGRAIQARAEGGKTLTAQRAKYKAVAGSVDARFAPEDAWPWVEGPDGEVRAAAFADFLVFGPPAGKFGAFLTAYKPTDERPMPTAADALAAAGWKPEWLGDSFKSWLVSDPSPKR